MNKEEKYLKDLMQELPREKAPENITRLIMQKIECKREFVSFPRIAFWNTLSFWIFLAVAISEVWLIWSSKNYVTVEFARTVYRMTLQKYYSFIAVTDTMTLLGYGVVFVFGVYFLITESLVERKCRLSI